MYTAPRPLPPRHLRQRTFGSSVPDAPHAAPAIPGGGGIFDFLFTDRLQLLLAALVAAALLFGPPGHAHATPRVIITVDVESQALSLPEQANAICADGSSCGLAAIVHLLRERGLAGTFFVNVYEAQRWGKPALGNIVRDLEAAGQDVELHTHPHWAFDPARNEMYQYNLDEQDRIIKSGAELLVALGAHPTVAHRAGDYSANSDTILALARNGIRVDSSAFAGSSRSLLAGIRQNATSVHDGVLEIPVSTYVREEYPKYFGKLLRPNASIRKLDPNWLRDEREARHVIDAFVDADVPYIVVFLHSFSLLSPSSASSPPRADRASAANLVAILDHVKKRGLRVVTMRAIAQDAPSAENRGGGVRVQMQVSVPRYVWHRLHSQPNALLGLPALIVVACVIPLVARRRARASEG